MGGVAGPQLVAAVAEAGAVGTLALYRMPPREIRAALELTRQLTHRPFGVNLIPELVSPTALSEQIETVLRASDPSVHFSFYGQPDAHSCEAVQRSGRAFLIKAGDVEGMNAAFSRGATAVILQGVEAGGHLLGTQALEELLAHCMESRPSGPLVCAGGISSGAELRRWETAGAAGCQCGTIFVATHESLAHAVYKRRIVESQANRTMVTDLFSIGWPGRRHRVIENPLTEPNAAALPPHFIARVSFAGRSHPIARYSAMVPTEQTTGKVEEMAMYGGLSVAGVDRVMPARERVGLFIAEFSAS